MDRALLKSAVFTATCFVLSSEFAFRIARRAFRAVVRGFRGLLQFRWVAAGTRQRTVTS